MPVIPAIPASLLVDVIPSVLSAGGNALQLNGVIVDANVGTFGYPVMPTGQILQFADAADVGTYFGALSQEAGLASVYFTGPNNATQRPGALLIASYALLPLGAYLRGGNVSGLTLQQLQAIDASLTISIDATPITQTINLSGATSFSNAAEIIGNTLAIKGTQQSVVTASLSSTTMTVSAVVQGPQEASVTASLSSTTMTVTAVGSGQLAVGQVVTGTGISGGTTIAALGTGTGGIGTYTLSAGATTESAETILAFSPTANLAVGMVVSGTGLTSGTYIAALGTGAGGTGTYTLSAVATTESDETVTAFAPGVIYSAQHGAFVINSGTTGVNSSVSFGTGAAAAPLALTQATGAVQSPGSAGNTPGSGAPIAFMSGITAQTLNWASFMTTWEPIDADKESFATWANSQQNRFVYEMWETNILDTESGGPSAPVAFINNGQLSGIEMIWTNPNVTTLLGEKAAFAMGFTASLDFTRTNGRTTAAFRGQSGLLPDVTNASVALELAGIDSNFGYGVNFYGDYTTPNQQFNLWQRGFVSGPFVWKDSYVDQIWLNSELQLAIMVGLQNTNSIPYNLVGNALIEAFCMDPINQAVNFGAIRAGVQLSAAQIQEVNDSAGLQIDQILFQRGWYLQVLASTAPAQVRATRSSPSCTLWYCDGGSVQRIVLASIEIH